MVLDTKGGPNWANNWCIAPVIVDTKKDEVYFTPLYYIMAHFSKFIRPDAKVIDAHKTDSELMVTAVKNPDGSIAVVVFNEGKIAKSFELKLGDILKNISISPQAIQTITLSNQAL
jgi:glucosylceramidase